MITNLDLECAELGRKLCNNRGGANRNDKRGKLITDSLSILEQQGVYAFFLYLKSRKSALATKLNDDCIQFLETMKLIDHKEDQFQQFKLLSNNLDKLLFTHDLLRRSLIYARYHEKAIEKSSLNE